MSSRTRVARTAFVALAMGVPLGLAGGAAAGAVAGDLREAESLLDRYERADWEERRSYAISEWDEACPAAARAANAR